MNQVEMSEREQAFVLLREVAEEFLRNRRRALGANVKPELIRRTFGGFKESELGFSSFKHFALAAKAGGFVDIYPAPTGPDIEILPPGAQPQPVHAATARSRVPIGVESIREDLWKAVVDWTPGLARVYDRDQDRVMFFAEEATALEPTDHTRSREAWQANRERYRLIEPAGMDGQIEWMREFVANLPDGRGRTILEFALSRDRPFREFTQAVREDQALYWTWHTFRKERVAQWLRNWMEHNDLDVEIFATASLPSPSGRVVGEAERRHEPGYDVAAVRERLHRAIDRMTVSDLLALSIPVEYMIDR